MLCLRQPPHSPIRQDARLSGVTLLELLVVTAVIGLLAAVLIPSMLRARQQARRLGCAMNLKAVGQALNLYRTDIGGYPDIGIRDGWKMFGTRWRYGDRKPGPRAGGQDQIADVAVALVTHSLGDPRTLYCPTSLANDPVAKPPYKTYSSGGYRVPLWRSGEISYVYMPGHDPSYPQDFYPDAQGKATYQLSLESPDRRFNRANPRTVLIGDRTVEFLSHIKGIGSNHGREGGWFCFTTGDVQWWSWERLTPHPTRNRLWYWPSLVRPAVKLAATAP